VEKGLPPKKAAFKSTSMDAVTDSAQLTIEQAIDNLIGPDLGLRFYSAWWLGKFQVKSPLAIDRLTQALNDEDDRTEDGGYPFRRNAARALGKLDAQGSVPALIEALECDDYYVREAAAQSLEMLGSAAAVPALVRRLNRGLKGTELDGQVPDLYEPYDALIEALGTLNAQEYVARVAPFLDHPVPRVQYAADRAMYQLTGDGAYGNFLIEALKGNDLQLRRAALSDVGAIGYLPAADAIAETLAENSLKLIALKGVLEKQILPGSSELSEGAIHVMNLMDSLL
jgi:phycocyanobilin lyase subunit alpha